MTRARKALAVVAAKTRGIGGSGLELVSLAVIVTGVCVLLGGGWGMIAGGIAGLVVARAVAD